MTSEEKPTFTHEQLTSDLAENHGMAKSPFHDFAKQYFPDLQIPEWQLKEIVEVEESLYRWIKTIPEDAWVKMNPELNGGDDVTCSMHNGEVYRRYKPLYQQLKAMEFTDEDIKQIFGACFKSTLSPIDVGRMLKSKSPVQKPLPDFQDIKLAVKAIIDDPHMPKTMQELNRKDRRIDEKEHGAPKKETIEERFRKARHAKIQKKKDAKK